MGASQSTSTGEKTFYGTALPKPTGPPMYDFYSLRMSDRLAQRLNNPGTVDQSSEISTTTTATSSSVLFNEDQVEEEVERRVRERIKEYQEQQAKFNHRLRHNSESYNTGVMIRHVDDVLREHEEQFPQSAKSPECERVEKALVECYEQNTDTVLNCAHLVTELQQLAHTASLQL